MKNAIDAQGNTVEVSDDTTVITVGSYHYLLTEDQQEEIALQESEWEEEATERMLTVIANNRRNTYIQESDPLFFKYQRGEATEQAWLDKVSEIKLRFPKPEIL